jgi:hypothetical protein
LVKSAPMLISMSNKLLDRRSKNSATIQLKLEWTTKQPSLFLLLISKAPTLLNPFTRVRTNLTLELEIKAS